MDKREEKFRLLFELIKGAKRSDRDLAKIMRISQPTLTRKRRILEKEAFIKEYTVIPDLEKMGYQIIALTFLSFTQAKPELIKEAREWTKKQPSIIFASDGEGLGMNSVMVSVHKNYASFSKLITQLRQDWQPNLKDIQSFMTSINRTELLVKPFSFRYLEADQN